MIVNNLVISWVHGTHDSTFNKCKLVLPATTCKISIVGEENPFAEGVAICAPEDIFAKETGRKLSLAKALQAAGKEAISRETRTLIWEAYRTSAQNPRW